MISRSLFSIILLLAQGTSYRLLKADLPKATDRLKEAVFAVSVERSTGRTEVESLICQVLAKEKPPKYEKLTILVFVDLDEYLPADDSVDLAEKNSRHQLAWYVWDRSLPRIRGRLVMMKDSSGDALDPWQSREFNQDKACSSRESQW